MKKAVLLVVVLLLLWNTACMETADDGEELYAFTDAAGNEISVPYAPKKVAVLYASFAETWTLAGGEIAVTVGESVERGFAEETAVLVDSGAGHTSILTERLIGEKPDFVIGSTEYPCQVAAVKVCRDAGIPAALFTQDSAAEYLSMLRIFCDILGNDEAWETYGQTVQAEMEEIRASLPENVDCSVLFLRGGSSARSTKAKGSEDSMVGEMLRELGVRNIADSAPVLLDGLSLETVLVEDPDWILISTMGDEEAAIAYCTSLLSGPGWSALTAVQSGHVVYLEKELFHYKPNARWPEAWRTLEQIIAGDQDG